VHTYPDEFQVLNVMSSAGASILGLGYLIPLVYLLWSLRWGSRAGPNPWHATGLEWTTPSPPPTSNFIETPIVRHEAYDYDALDAEQEFEARPHEIEPADETVEESQRRDGSAKTPQDSP
jgi:cytochrome c oxidase subunit 1